MYDLASHLTMMRDPVRVPAYEAAIRAQVRPGDIVLDLGAGAGLMTFIALAAGASHVYALELSEAIEVARDVARANGCGTQVTFIQGDSTRLEIPERVDVIVADIRGCLPFLGNSMATLEDARTRFLKPGGRIIPVEDAVWLAPVECPAGRVQVEGWRTTWGMADYASVATLASNQWRRQVLKGEDLLAAGRSMPAINYMREIPGSLRLEARFEVTRAGGGSCDGLGAWFATELAPGIRFSTMPGERETVYGHALFPLSGSHRVEPGDVIEADVQLLKAREAPLWTWTLSISSGGRARVEERHSSFEGRILSLDHLARRVAGFVPVISEEGEIDRFVLEHMDGLTSLGDIAREVAARFPAKFPTWEHALGEIGKISEKYSRSAAPCGGRR